MLCLDGDRLCHAVHRILQNKKLKQRKLTLWPLMCVEPVLFVTMHEYLTLKRKKITATKIENEMRKTYTETKQ